MYLMHVIQLYTVANKSDSYLLIIYAGYYALICNPLLVVLCTGEGRGGTAFVDFRGG